MSLPALPLPGSGGYRLPLRRRAIADRLVALEPDLIEAGDPYAIAWAAVDAARRRGAPAVAYCHSNLEAMARLVAGPRFAGVAGRAARAYARRVYGRFDAVLAPSASMRRHLLDWGIRDAACQPLGVDTAVFHPSRADPAWRDRHGVAATDRLLVYAGRFAAEKNLDVLAAAVDRLGAPYTLLAIGAGPRPPSGRRVRVVPFVAGPEALATALASADAFVHAGDQETFGLSALEAMACAHAGRRALRRGPRRARRRRGRVRRRARHAAGLRRGDRGAVRRSTGRRSAQPPGAAPKRTTGSACCRRCSRTTAACSAAARALDAAAERARAAALEPR